MKLSVLIVFLLVLVICAPLLTIYVVNYLFGAGIEYSFFTWLAMLWLHLLLAGGASN